MEIFESTNWICNKCKTHNSHYLYCTGCQDYSNDTHYKINADKIKQFTSFNKVIPLFFKVIHPVDDIMMKLNLEIIKKNNITDIILISNYCNNDFLIKWIKIISRETSAKLYVNFLTNLVKSTIYYLEIKDFVSGIMLDEYFKKKETYINPLLVLISIMKKEHLLICGFDFKYQHEIEIEEYPYLLNTASKYVDLLCITSKSGGIPNSDKVNIIKSFYPKNICISAGINDININMFNNSSFMIGSFILNDEILDINNINIINNYINSKIITTS